jgi:hypothetical protein
MRLLTHRLARIKESVNHNVDSHGTPIGTQLRRSEEIQKQRSEE